MATDRLDASWQVQQLIGRLNAPIEDLETLISLLAAPLDCLSLLPPRFHRHNTAPLPKGAFQPTRHISLIQRALLEHVLPSWQPALEERDAMALVDQLFVPDAFVNATPAAGLVSLYAYSTILFMPLKGYALNLLIRLAKSYPVDRLHTSVFNVTDLHVGQTSQMWEDAVKNVLSVPARVANALKGKDVPAELETGRYFHNLCVRCEALLASLTEKHYDMTSLSFLFTKLVNVGAFPPSRPASPSQPSFFGSTLQTIRSRTASSPEYAALWRSLLGAIPSTMALQSILTSLFAHLQVLDSALSTDARERGLVKREADLLSAMLGPVKAGRAVWNVASAVIIGRDWSEAHARIFVCWAASGSASEQGLQTLLDGALETWTLPEYIKHSLLSKHRFLTLLVLLSHANLPPTSPRLKELPFSLPFVQCITHYLSHLDPSVRRCGMLVAEEIARRAGKDLDFKDWDGPGAEWARAVRALLVVRDADAPALEDDSDDEGAGAPALDIRDLLTDEILESEPARKTAPTVELAPSGYDSDDSLVGYASPPQSDRAASPTPSELAEIEKDPTLNVGKKRVARPVYLAQLGLLLRGPGGTTSGDDDEPERIEVALDAAEELIRRKRSYGSELEENAVNLVYGLASLNDKFELADFARKRQLALIALVACSPTKAAPSVIEEFFKHQYSMDQRFVLLNALALGARELSGAAAGGEWAPPPDARVGFASRRLPPALHARMLEAESGATARVQGLLEGAARAAIAGTREAAEGRLPEAARERQLRLRPARKVTEVQPASGLPSASANESPSTPAFATLAVEHFIYPLMHRFWQHVRDAQAREAASAARAAAHRYHGAGTGLILAPLVLAHVLATLGVLVHCGRAAPGWLALAAPDALELGLTIGTQRISRDMDEEEGGEEGGSEAGVLAAALELALVVLDGSAEVDGGRTLALEHTALLLAAGEWAQTVFGGLEKGLRVKGGGGAAEQRLSRASAGVTLKVDEIREKWRRAMIGV